MKQTVVMNNSNFYCCQYIGTQITILSNFRPFPISLRVFLKIPWGYVFNFILGYRNKNKHVEKAQEIQNVLTFNPTSFNISRDKVKTANSIIECRLSVDKNKP